MIQIILQVLAVIGIILLCLLGLLLTVVLLILFAPVRYQISGRMEETLECRVKVTWLLHLLSVSFDYPEPGQIIAKVLGIRIKKISLKEEQKREEAGAESKPQTEPMTEQKTGSKPQILPQDPAPKDSTDKKSQAEKADSSSKMQKKCTFCTVCDKIKKIATEIKYYWTVLRDQENKQLFARCRRRLAKVLRHMCPKVLQGDLLIGTGAPDTTGYVLAVYGMLFPVLGNHINITPDFENKVFQGNWSVKGRIRVAVLLKNALAVAFDRQLRIFIRQLKKEGK